MTIVLILLFIFLLSFLLSRPNPVMHIKAKNIKYLIMGLEKSIFIILFLEKSLAFLFLVYILFDKILLCRWYDI